MSPLSSEEKTFLFRLARRSLEAAVRGERMDAPAEFPRTLGSPGGVFVSLHQHGALRGCVGYVEALKPLYQTVIEAAAAAALHDSRFPRVDSAELAGLEVEISVLSPFWEVRLEEIQVGLHGLMVTRGFARGLLLPQVAVERDWTVSQFLAETCRKAGLPSDAWERGAKIEAFTAEVFSERTLALKQLQD